MSTSTVRIIHSNSEDVTDAYVRLWRQGKPLSGLTAGLGGTPLSTALARLAHDGKRGGDDGQALDDATFEVVREVAAAGAGTFVTPNGWTVTVTADPLAPVLGLEKGASPFQDGISIAQLDEQTSGTGNSVLRVGRTVSNTDLEWTQSEHVVLSPADRRRLVAGLLEHMDPIDRQEVLDEVIDRSSSNSVQHFIDTGAYLSKKEAADWSASRPTDLPTVEDYHRAKRAAGWCSRCGHGYEVQPELYPSLPRTCMPTCECAGDPPVDKTSPEWTAHVRQAAALRHVPQGVTPTGDSVWIGP